jgi:hypothetical protein
MVLVIVCAWREVGHSFPPMWLQLGQVRLLLLLHSATETLQGCWRRTPFLT